MSAVQAKTVLVTGAAGGLGKAIAEAFLAAGANVVICDIHADRLSATSAEWAASPHGPARFLALRADVTSEAAVEQLVADAAARFGRLDVLVNNAGVLDDFSPAGACARDTWDRVLAVNLTGPYLTTRFAVAQFERQQAPGTGTGTGTADADADADAEVRLAGTIINIASLASQRGLSAGAAYTASKTGLLGLTRNTAGYYGPRGVSAVALVIGGMEETHIAEPMMKGFLHAEGYQRSQAATPGYVVGRTNVRTASVAKYCVFLADDEIAQAANGSCINFSKNWPAA